MSLGRTRTEGRTRDLSPPNEPAVRGRSRSAERGTRSGRQTTLTQCNAAPARFHLVGACAVEGATESRQTRQRHDLPIARRESLPAPTLAEVRNMCEQCRDGVASAKDTAQRFTLRAIQSATPELALACLEALHTNGIGLNDTLAAAAIRAYSRGNRVDRYHEVLDVLTRDKTRPGHKTWGAMRDGYKQVGESDKAEACWTKQNLTNGRLCEAFKRGEDYSGREVTVRDVQALTLSKITQQKDHLPIDPDDAWACLDNMEKADVPPNDRIAAAMIRLLTQTGRPDEVRFVLDALDHHGMEPGVETYGALISLHIHYGHPERAHNVAAKMRTEGLQPDWITRMELARLPAWA